LVINERANNSIIMSHLLMMNSIKYIIISIISLFINIISNLVETIVNSIVNTEDLQDKLLKSS